MKTAKTILIGLVSLVFLLGLERGSVAFHNGGVGECDGCHSMHNSSGGEQNIAGRSFMQGTGPYLLKANDQSGACLNCHSRSGDSGPTTYHISTPYNESSSVLQPGIPPKQLTPGGDFGWLFKEYQWSSPTGPMESKGERHGHNIVAMDFSYVSDLTYQTAPGGSYPSSSLGCTSCHDPHGTYRRDSSGAIMTTGRPIAGTGSFASSRDPDILSSVGVYRLLGGQGYRPRSLIGGLGFVYGPPAAVAPDKPNRSEAITQTRVAYGAGMSEWCMNCHPGMHVPPAPGPSNLMHPSGATAKLFGATMPTRSDVYNSYVKKGDLTGSSFSSYLSLVPFEEGTADYSALKSRAKTDNSVLTGPGPGAQVMCLSCHRAHASGWDGAMRWNSKTEYIVYNGSYASNPVYAQGRSEAEARQAYYDRPASVFAMNQDTLCNKCHNGVYP